MMELKPCPFCGGAPRLIPHDQPAQSVVCDCGARMTVATVINEAAPEAWNRRAESDLADETLKWKITDEALRSSCDEVAKLKRENADLLAALKELVRLCGHSALDDDCPVCVATANARAAITRHT